MVPQYPIYEFPRELLQPEKNRFFIGRRHLLSAQPWTAYMRVQGPVDERWVTKFSVANYQPDEWSRLEALMNRMDGQAGFVTAFDPARIYPRGSATGPTPRTLGFPAGQPFSDGSYFSDGSGFVDVSPHIYVAAASHKGSDLVCVSGLKPNSAVAMAENDLLCITAGGLQWGYLHSVVADAASDSTGFAVLRIRPRLRRAVVAGDLVRIHHPTGVFSLSSEEDTQVERSYPLLGSFGCTLIEAPEVIEVLL